MPNLNDLDPNDISTTPQQSSNQPAPTGNINDLHPDDVQSEEDYYSTPGQMLATAGEGALEGALGPLGPAVEKGFGVNPEGIRKRAETNPLTHGLSEATTFAGSMLAGTGEGAIVGKIGEGAAALAGLGEATTGAKIATGAVKSAAEMAALQASDETSKAIEEDPNQSLGSAAINIGLSGIIGGAGGAALGSISPLWKATMGDGLQTSLNSVATDAAANSQSGPQIRPIVKNILSTFGGVGGQDIDNYLANHAAIQNAPGFQEIYEKVLDHIGGISDDVEANKLSVSEAKAKYQDLESSVKDDLRSKGFDASVANSMAKQSLNDAQSKLAYDLQQKALDAGPHVAQATEALRSNIINQSQDAYETLALSGKPVPLKPFFSKAHSLISDLEAEGTLEAKSQAQRIQQYTEGIKDQFNGLDAVSGPEAKKLIQGLDKVSSYDFNATSFDKGLSRSYKQLRYTLDDTLKSAIPEYAEKMKPLAQDSQLLRSLDRYGDEDSAVRAIKSIKNPDKFKTEFPMLKELEKRTGTKFLDQIEPYANPELRDKLMKALPQFKDAQEAASYLQAIKDPKASQGLMDSLSQSNEFKAKEAAEQGLSGALEKQQEIKGLTPQSLQGKLNSVKNGKSIANKAMLENIKVNGQSVPRLLELARMGEMFDKNATRGSKHVNLYGGITGGLMGLVGGIPGVAGGAAAGAGIGAAVDNYGPQAVRKILDSYMERFGNISKMSGDSSGSAARTMLQKMLSSGAPPNAEAFKTGTDYVSSVAKGDRLLKNATQNLFKAGAQILPQNILPDHASREKLQKTLDTVNENPNKAIGVGGNIGHYLPDHATAAGAMAATAQNYLNNLKPKQSTASPLDAKPPIDKSQEAKYNRALDIAQQPLLVLQHVKDGTLQPQDVQTLNTIYPGLHNKIVSKLSDNLISAKTDDVIIPYSQKQSLSLLMGSSLDSTLTQGSMQAIMNSAQKPQQQAPQGKPKQSSQTMAQMSKVNSMYSTPLQAREQSKRES